VSVRNKRGQETLHPKTNATSMERRKLPLASDGDAWTECRQRALAVVAGFIKGTDISADDVAQVAMERAWARRSQFKGEAEFTTWLYSISVHTALDFLKEIRSNVISLDDVSVGGPNLSTRAPEPRARSVDMIRIIQAHELLDRLSPQEAAIVRSWMRDEEPEVIGRRLGVSADVVRQRVSRAIRRLAKGSEQENKTKPISTRKT
jgi:RNA polymerase sigma factor (sigma-70 family)